MPENAISGLPTPGGAVLVTTGGKTPTYDITAASVIKATPGRLCTFIPVAVGSTSGAWTFNDCATTGAAAASNEIASIAYTALTAGIPIQFNWPCLTGIVLSAVPGGSPVASISFD